MLIRVAVMVVSAFLCSRSAWPQDAPPVVKAHSRVVTITDGAHVKKGYWYVMPEKVPDVYYVEVPLRPHTVTFTTDVESISFQVTYGSVHTFVIQLQDGTQARTEVRAAFRNLLPLVRRDPAAPATIPFTLGDNDKIYVKGRINGGPELDCQFDLGAGGNIIKKASVSKVRMQFDGTIRLRNSDGDNMVPSSSTNRLDIAGLRWEKVQFAVADNMTHREDLLIGNVLFQDKVVELDYDRMVITIHDTLPPLTSGWVEQEMILDGVVPFTRGTLTMDDSSRAGWFMLDTGAYTSILHAPQLTPTRKIVRELTGMVGGRGSGLSVSIGGQTIDSPNYSVRRYDGDESALGLLGNDLLKRFNLILDNRQGVVYFRPNSFMRDGFRNPESYLVRIVAAAVAAVTAATIWGVRRRLRRSQPTTAS